MKKLLILSLGFVLLGFPSETKSQTEESTIEGDTVVCPSGDKYTCMESHGDLGTIYRGKGKIIVIG